MTLLGLCHSVPDENAWNNCFLADNIISFPGMAVSLGLYSNFRKPAVNFLVPSESYVPVLFDN